MHESHSELFARDKCKVGAPGAMWGVWIDGRDAVNGSLAYGERYDKLMANAYQLIMQRTMAPLRVQSSLTNADMTWLMRSIDAFPRDYRNPVCQENMKCLHVLPPHKVDGIMASVQSSVADECRLNQTLDNATVASMLAELTAEYNSQMSITPAHEALPVIAKFMKNIAYLHPLNNRNGRFRLMLLQFELRRRGIACGTMMWNNNKNIYFETVEEYTLRIQEGIDAFNEAQSSGFVSNPWQGQDAVQRHLSRFPDTTNGTLEACWKSVGCQKGLYKSCMGTSAM